MEAPTLSAKQIDDVVSRLIDDSPDQVHVIQHVSTGRYGCFCFQGIHGLACFSHELDAMRFGERIELNGLDILELPFDEAREVAKGRPFPVVSLMLLDRIESPVIHFIR